MRYDNLPIYKKALDFCVYIETIVKSFEKYHKYSIGQDLREYCKKILFMINKANLQENKTKLLDELVQKCEETKMLLHICKELKTFRSFKQFEHSSKLCVEVCKQAQSWLNYYQNQKDLAGVLR